MFQPSDLPTGIILLITDALASPADFVLHRTLTTHLKDQPRPHALVLSVSEGIARWTALAAKNNVNLQHHVTTGALQFIDVLTSTAVGGGLYDILHRVRAFLAQAPQGEAQLVILDDITMLEWTGVPLLDVVRFFRALRSVCLKSNATLFVRHHIITPNDPDDLFRHLLQICNYHLEVSPLSSGKSGSVSGEISLHHGFSVPRQPIKPVPRSMATQYKLTDVGATYFAKGTSGNVL